jgi:hypothetical protein
MFAEYQDVRFSARLPRTGIRGAAARLVDAVSLQRSSSRIRYAMGSLSVAYGVGTRRLARRLVAGVASWLQRVDRQSQLGHRSGGRAWRGNHCQPHCLQVSKTRLVRRCLREDGPLIAASLAWLGRPSQQRPPIILGVPPYRRTVQAKTRAEATCWSRQRRDVAQSTLSELR